MVEGLLSRKRNVWIIGVYSRGSEHRDSAVVRRENLPRGRIRRDRICTDRADLRQRYNLIHREVAGAIDRHHESVGKLNFARIYPHPLPRFEPHRGGVRRMPDRSGH